jgi:hypothetical protein
MPADADTIAQVRQLHECKIGFESFGDTTMLFSPIGREDRKPTADGIFVILSTCARIMYEALARGIALRGGISLGVAAQLDGGEAYGPAALQAYELERDCAGYPRIVVDEAVKEYLQQLFGSEGQEQQDGYNRGIATRCLDLLTTDEDGLQTIDYLGPGFKKAFGRTVSSDGYKRGLKFVSDAYMGFVNARDCKLAPRYAWLLRYYNRNKAHWADVTVPLQNRRSDRKTEGGTGVPRSCLQDHGRCSSRQLLCPVRLDTSETGTCLNRLIRITYIG